MNFQNRNIDKLKDIDESTIEKPEENYKKAESEINPTVTFYKDIESNDIENIKVIDMDEEDMKDDKPVVSDRDTENKSSKKKKLLVYLIFILVLGSAFFIYMMSSSKDKKEVKEATKTSRATPISIKKIERTDFKVYEKTIGSISNLDMNSVASEVSGLVKKVNVDIGDTVKAGQIVAVIDSNEARNNLISSQSEIKRIEALLLDSKKTQSRYKKLIKEGFVSQADLDTLNANIKSYEEQLVNAKAILSNNKIRLDKTIIRAPKSGVIQQRHITTGTFVSVSTPLFDIVNNNSLMVIASMPESFSYRLKKDQPVTLKITGTDFTLTSKIKELKPVIDEQSRSISIIVDVPSNDYNLKPGGTLEVYISMENKKDVVIIPESAVVLRITGKVVYVYNEDNTVTEVPIQTGAYQDGLVEVLMGLKGNEMIVIDGAGFLSDKAMVTISK